MLNTRKFKRFTKHLEVISRFDQFCDYTSIVGFRLLHSGNPTWVRLLTLSFLSAFCIMVLVQTRDAFLRFFDDSFKPMPRFEASQTDPIYRAGIMVCTEQQVASILNGYGSLDFRLLLFEYIKNNPDKKFFLRVEQEFKLLDQLFNSSFGDLNENKIRRVRQQLKNFPEISAYLDFDIFNSDPHVLLQLPDYKSFSIYQNSLKECWKKFWGKTNKRQEFVHCQWEKARSTFEEFRYLNEKFFEYFQNVSLKYEDLVLDANLYRSNFKHEQRWHIKHGLCVLIKPENTLLNENEIDEKTNDEYLLRTNYFESEPDGSNSLFLYDAYNERILNKVDLVSGEYLEISIYGYSETQNEFCRNYYPPDCSKVQNRTTKYSSDKCQMCSIWTKICNCSVPNFHHTDITLRNCSLFESVDCVIRYKQEMLKESECQADCQSTSYIINTRQQPIEREMLQNTFEVILNRKFQKLSWDVNRFYKTPKNSKIRM